MALVRIEDLAPASVLTGAELLEIEQGGVSLKVTAQEVADLGGGGGGGSGDVVGPALSTGDHIAVFNGATGKIIKDGGRNIADLFLDVVGTASLSGGTLTVDSNAGRVRNFNATMTASATLSVTNLPSAGRECEFEMLIKQDATGGHALTLPANLRPLGGSDTAIATAANSMTMMSAKSFDGGAMWVYAMQEVG